MKQIPNHFIIWVLCVCFTNLLASSIFIEWNCLQNFLNIVNSLPHICYLNSGIN